VGCFSLIGENGGYGLRGFFMFAGGMIFAWWAGRLIIATKITADDICYNGVTSSNLSK
jgi:hypothetical protein